MSIQRLRVGVPAQSNPREPPSRSEPFAPPPRNSAQSRKSDCAIVRRNSANAIVFESGVATKRPRRIGIVGSYETFDGVAGQLVHGRNDSLVIPVPPPDSQ